MKITVTKDNVKIEEFDIVHEGEHRVNKCSFSFSEEYTEELVKKAIFTSQNSSVEVAIINNECNIPTEILKARNIVLLGVYAYKVVDDKLDLRYSPSPDAFKVNSGSYIEGANESEEITPSQFEQYMQAMNDGLNKVEESIKKMDEATSSANDLVDNINQKLENGDFIGPEGTEGPQGVPGTNGKDGVGITTITSGQPTIEEDKTITPVTVNKTDGSSQSFKVEAKNGIDGQNGKDGQDGVNGQDGLTPTIGDNGNWFIGDTDTGKPSRGEVGPTPDLTDYVKNTDYATGEKGGVVKVNSNSATVNENGYLEAQTITQDKYDKAYDSEFISKGTLESIKDDYVGSSTPVQDLTSTVTNIQEEQDESKPKNTASGEMITVDDALAYKTFNVTVDGASEQETTTGKNLLPYPYTETSMSINGITFIVNEDGTVIINGTASANASLKLYGQDGEQKQIIGNYLFGGSNNVWLRAVNKNDSGYTVICTSKENSSVAIDKSTYTEGYIELIVPAGTTVNDEVIYPMMTLEPDTNYEPYTGGQPSPSPDYPQQIKTLTFDKITRCGKNMTDISSTSYSQNCTVENGVATTIPLNNYGWANIGMTPIIIPAGTYYLSCDIRLKSGTANKMNYLRLTGCDFTSVTNPAMTNDFQRYVFSNTISQQERYTTFGIQTDKSTDAVLEIKNIMISKTNGNYEPYQAREYAIDLQGNEMVEIPNVVKDELVIDKQGNVSLIKNVGKYFFDGSEDWSSIPDTDMYWEFMYIFPTGNQANYTYSLSNYFSNEDYNRLICTKLEVYIRFPKNIGIDVSDAEKFKSWLQSHNTIAYYELTEPQTIPLGKLTDIITTLNGANNISINGNIPTTISTTYALDIKKYIDNKLAEISTAMIEEG